MKIGAVAPQAIGDRAARSFRQLVLDDERIERAALDARQQRMAAVRGRRHAEPPPLERPLARLAQIPVVRDKEY